MSAGHTPGPWKIEADRDPSARQKHPDHYFIQIGEIGTPGWKGSVSGHCGLANARLIAAAPDLLTAAKAVLQSSFAQNYVRISPFKELAEAVAKAEGRS